MGRAYNGSLAVEVVSCKASGARHVSLTSRQVTFENSDSSAASALATSMRNTGGSTIYVPGFGNAAVDNVKEFTVPADAKLSLCARARRGRWRVRP